MPSDVAIVYDFDGTLARGNLQEASFIPEIGMERSEFWDTVKATAKQHDADEILVYMQLMLLKAQKNGIKVTRRDLERHGAAGSLFPGLADQSWFQRINRFGAESNLNIKHYIVSSGLKEMILGSPIAHQMDHIFASSFIYENEVAVWPALAINYTTKTQYLFRINKGILNAWDGAALNAYMHNSERPVPFERIIFVGDGDTDIPTMKMTTYQGGYSVAVYDPSREDHALHKVHKLISDNRVNFVAPADFSENSHFDIIIKGVLGRMARRAALATTRPPKPSCP